MTNRDDLLGLDEEWVKLIIEAKNMGVKPEEVRDFFENGVKNELRWTDSSNRT